MKRIALIILSLFLFFINISSEAADNYMTKEIKAVSTDGFNIVATFTYPKSKTQKEYKTVVLLHSLGYNSSWWNNLPQLLLDKGYAVVNIDLRGHGKSVYNSKLQITSWKNLTNNAYAKYPEDVLAVIKEIIRENTKKTFFNEWAIVGCDIGASAGIIAADKLNVKPKTIVMVVPILETKGLYIPVKMAQLGDVDYLSIMSEDDLFAMKDSAYIKKFAQKGYTEYKSNSKTSGMVMLKNDPELTRVISKWVEQYLN